tara:strand:- start:1134 stop:1535 length:402 start_codon:yes stop_codon:yes gene_type:complete
LLISSSISLADIEDEIYSPDYEEEAQLKNKEINFEKDISFNKLITCLFITSDYKRIFRFGITNKNEFFYRKSLKENKKIKSYGGETLFLNKKNNIYYLNIERKSDKLEIVVDFNNKKSNLFLNSKLIKRTNCK